MKKIYYTAFLVINTILSISAMGFGLYPTDLQNVLPEALNESLLGAILRNESIANIKSLLDVGADINNQDSNGVTPLLRAVVGGCIDLVRMLVEYGVDINAEDKHGDTLLYNSNVFGNKKIMEILIENGAHINTKNFDGVTPLHRVILRDDIEAVRYFIKKGADVVALNDLHESPLHFFCLKGEGLIGTNSRHAKGVELLTTAPMVFKNIKSVDLIKNKAPLKKLDIFTFRSTDKMFEMFKALPVPAIENLVSFIFPLNDSIESKYIEKFVLKCYMNSSENISKLFIAELCNQHLLELKAYISIKNKAQASALDLARFNNKVNIVTYFNEIYTAQKYDDLDEGLRGIIEENYKNRLAPEDYFENKETTLGMPLMNLKQLMEIVTSNNALQH